MDIELVDEHLGFSAACATPVDAKYANRDLCMIAARKPASGAVGTELAKQTAALDSGLGLPAKDVASKNPKMDAVKP